MIVEGYRTFTCTCGEACDCEGHSLEAGNSCFRCVCGLDWSFCGGGLWRDHGSTVMVRQKIFQGDHA